MASNPNVAAPPAAPAAAAEVVAEARLRNEVKDMLIYELKAKGYSPNPADVATMASRVVEMVKDSGGKAGAYVSAQDAKLKAFQEFKVKEAANAKVAADKATAEAEAAKKPGAPAPPEPLVLGAGEPIPAIPHLAPPPGPAPSSGFSFLPAGGALPNAVHGVPYVQALHIANGKGPFKFQLIGSLPGGLLLGADSGVISGTPTGEPGLSSFQVSVTDSAIPAQVAKGAFSIAVA